MLIRREKHIILLLIVLLVCIFANSYYTILNKEGFFLDEVYTFLLANTKIISFNDFISLLKNGELKHYMSVCVDSLKNMEFTNEEFMKNLSVPFNDGFNFFSVYVAQSADVHPMLYYIIVHSVSSITHCNDLRIIGFSINIFFQLITCVFLFLLMRKILNNSWIAIITIVYYGFSFGFLNITTYFRMYCVLTCWMTILSYLYYRILTNEYYSKKEVVLMCILEFLSLSTQYFSFVFLVIYVFLMSKKIYQKYGMPELRKFLKPHIITLLLFFVTWPQILWHFISGSNQHCGIFSLNKYYYFMKIFVNSQFGRSYILFTIFMLLSVSMFRYTYIHKNREGNEQSIKKFSRYVLLPVILFYVIVSIISPWADYRYVSVVSPLLSIVVIFVLFQSLYFLDKKLTILRNNKVKLCLLFCYVVATSISWRPIDNLPHIYKQTHAKEDFIKKYSKYPSVILNLDNTGIFVEIPFHYKHSKYIKIDYGSSCDYLPSHLNEDNYILYINKRLKIDDLSNVLESAGYTYSRIDYSSSFHDVYMVENHR